MRRTLTAVLLAAMLAFSLVPAYADPVPVSAKSNTAGCRRPWMRQRMGK